MRVELALAGMGIGMIGVSIALGGSVLAFPLGEAAGEAMLGLGAAVAAYGAVASHAGQARQAPVPFVPRGSRLGAKHSAGGEMQPSIGMTRSPSSSGAPGPRGTSRPSHSSLARYGRNKEGSAEP